MRNVPNGQTEHICSHLRHRYSVMGIVDVLSLNNLKFGDYVGSIYPIELEIPQIWLGLLHTLTYI